MASVLVSIADAVCAALNAGTFSQAFTAVRKLVPVYQLGEMDTLHVVVSPNGIPDSTTGAGRSAGPMTRAAAIRYYAIDVAVMQRVDPDDEVATDALLQLVEELLDALDWEELAIASNPRCIKADLNPVVSDEHLDQWRQFTAVIQLVYQVIA